MRFDRSSTPASFVVLGLLLLLGGTVLPLAAQDAAPEPAPAEERSADADGSRYEVIPLSDGVLVLPLDEADFERFEISERGLYLDGEAVSSREVRERLGEEGEKLLEEHRSDRRRRSRRFTPRDAEEVEAAVQEAAEAAAEEAARRAEEIEERLRERFEELQDLRADELDRIVDELEEDRGPRRKTRGRMAFGRSLRIAEDESSEDVVVIGGSLDVDGEIRGDAVVVGGPIRIDGEVDGSATSVGSSVRLGPGARVGGDAVSVGDVVDRHRTARVRGEIIEIPFAPEIHIDPSDWDWRWGWWPGLSWGGHNTWGGFWDKVRNLILLFLMAGLVTLLVRRPADRVADRLEQEPWKAVLVGLVTQVLFAVGLPLLCLVLVISIVGILLVPLVVPLGIVAFVILLVFGFTASATVSGRMIRSRFGWPGENAYFVLFAGVVLIQMWSLAGQALSWTGGPLYLSAMLLLLFGFFVKYLAWTAGLGAVLMGRFSPDPVVPPPLPSWDPPPGDPSRFGALDPDWENDPDAWNESEYDDVDGEGSSGAGEAYDVSYDDDSYDQSSYDEEGSGNEEEADDRDASDGDEDRSR